MVYGCRLCESTYKRRIGNCILFKLHLCNQPETKINGGCQPGETACLAPKIDWRNYQWTLINWQG